MMAPASAPKAFLNSCRQLGIRIQPEWTFQAAPTIAGGPPPPRNTAFSASAPRVIYYENDSMAQGGLYTLARSGIRVPQDAEVLCIGLRKPEMNHCLNPALSCITIPQTVDRQAVALLLRLIQELPAAPLHVEMEPQVQLRESFTLPENAPREQPVKMFHVKHLFVFNFSAPSFSHLYSKHPPTGDVYFIADFLPFA